MTPSQLDEIDARQSKATAGPWGICPETNGTEFVAYKIKPWAIRAVLFRAPSPWEQDWLDNAEFIAHAREDIPALLAEVRRLREALRWALPLAEMAMDQHRTVRIEAGHTDIRGTYKSGETWVGIHQSEVDQIEAARRALTGAAE